MTKAEQKKAVQFTRMCKFWRTNECKMGTDCKFAHDTAELRPSPKPCFEFSKTGSCVRGQACRFVHLADGNGGKKSGGKSSGLRVSVQQAGARQHPLAGASLWPMAFAPYAPAGVSTPMPELDHILLPLQPSVVPSPCFHPPPGLHDAGLMDVWENGACSTLKLMDGGSRRSSFSDDPLGLEHLLSIPKADPDDLATHSWTTTMCLSSTPASFSESDGPERTSFWL
ncbi:unnamed protein product [Symbiodinium natans]|uniref:C3H1-type domain-containing protein n=1 Tax=Symbiodinium natans TaxID=878477 RepID=A0A812PC14_9DINO|nr:unnamed protein product [Symbiodinium natans]